MDRRMTDGLIYHMLGRADWQAAKAEGLYRGSRDDRRDGFIHFSSPSQVRQSAARHHAGRADLILLSVDAQSLGEALTWEPSRDGKPFPHLYGDLPVSMVTRADDLPLGADGTHLFPETIAAETKETGDD